VLVAVTSGVPGAESSPHLCSQLAIGPTRLLGAHTTGAMPAAIFDEQTFNLIFSGNELHYSA
jgi:hypothetical protein